MNEFLFEYLPILMFLAIAGGLAAVILLASFLIARQRPSLELMDGHAVTPPAESSIFFLEQQAEVQAALRRLPAEQAEVVVLKIWEELTFQEIAAVTGESPNTVASRYRYALTKLECSLKRLASEVGYVVQ